jgi:nucleotide-binding universal stress UspA family protein
MVTITSILVGTDFSKCADNALMYGRELAHMFNAKLYVLHTVETFIGDVAGLGGYTAAIPNLQYDIEQAERDSLEKLVTADDRARFGAVPVFTTEGRPAHALTEFATASHIDLIIVGTHGRRGLSHALMGSVAERVVRTAPCPVLTVREREHEFATRDLPAVCSVTSGTPV